MHLLSVVDGALLLQKGMFLMHALCDDAVAHLRDARAPVKGREQHDRSASLTWNNASFLPAIHDAAKRKEGCAGAGRSELVAVLVDFTFSRVYDAQLCGSIYKSTPPGRASSIRELTEKCPPSLI